MWSDLQHDLGSGRQRHVRRPAVPAATVDEYDHSAAAERGEPVVRERLTPGAEQASEPQSGPGPEEHDSRRIDRHQVAVASRRGDPPVDGRARRPCPDSSGNDHDPVGGEQLDVNLEPGPEPRRARSDHGTGDRRLESWAGADRPGLGEQMARDRARWSLYGGRSASRQERHRDAAQRQCPPTSRTRSRRQTRRAQVGRPSPARGRGGGRRDGMPATGC
jgi:hypothetical protein